MAISILSLCMFAGIAYAIHRVTGRRRLHRKDIYFFRIYNGVTELKEIVEQLEQVEQMITDIEVCSFHHLKAVKIEVPDSLSSGKGHEIIINGSDNNSRYLLSIAVEERQRLRTSLLKGIESLSRYGVTKTVTITESLQQGTSGEWADDE